MTALAEASSERRSAKASAIHIVELHNDVDIYVSSICQNPIPRKIHVNECSKTTLLAACSLFRGSHPKLPLKTQYR